MPTALTSQSNLALVLGDLGRLEEAEAEHRAVLEIRARVLGAEYPDTLTSRSHLASALCYLGGWKRLRLSTGRCGRSGPEYRVLSTPTH